MADQTLQHRATANRSRPTLPPSVRGMTRILRALVDLLQQHVTPLEACVVVGGQHYRRWLATTPVAG
jgi:hypothetical protein